MSDSLKRRKEIIDLLEKADSNTNWGDCCSYVKKALALLKQQPPASEFTKKLRVLLATQDKTVIVQDAYDLCEHFDSAEATKADLLKVLEEASKDFYYIHQHPEDAHTDSYTFMEKVEQAKKAAIAKYG